MDKPIRIFFYGNLFLGICAVALCIEADLLIDGKLNSLLFYFLIFLCTVVYYTMIYLRSVNAIGYDERTLWYRKHFLHIKRTLKICLFILVALIVVFIAVNLEAFRKMSVQQFALLAAFPLTAYCYTFSFSLFGSKGIRQVGWLKPFVVAFTWAGWVTVYPVVISQLQAKQYNASLPGIFPLLWIQNFLFITVLALLFDIKDYKDDLYHKLRTPAVILGVKKSIGFIIFPAIVIGLIVFTMLQHSANFTPAQTAIQLIPYLLLLAVAINSGSKKSLWYYLVAVDGLLFAKAVCGITSIIFFKKPTHV